jgi:hypothetical protein
VDLLGSDVRDSVSERLFLLKVRRTYVRVLWGVHLFGDSKVVVEYRDPGLQCAVRRMTHEVLGDCSSRQGMRCCIEARRSIVI